MSKHTSLTLLATLTVSLIYLIGCKSNETLEPIEFEKIDVNYTDTRMDSTVVEDYHGNMIADPYRWLEDDHSDETKDWVGRQNAVTFDYLDKIPYREKIKNRLEDLWNYEKYSTPFKEGDYYYYFKNDGLQNQSVMYRIKELGDAPEVVLDPNEFSEDGTSSLAGLGFSGDSKHLAYLISTGGSDWRKAKVMNLETGDLLSDELDWIKFSGVNWMKDGFYYSRYPEPKEEDALSAKNEYHKVYYHKLGTDQSEDELIYEDKKNPQRNMGVGVSEDERFLFLFQSESTSGNSLAFKDLSNPSGDFVHIVKDFENDYSPSDSDGDRIFMVTNADAPNQKVIEIDAKNPDRSNWKELIPESDNPLRGIAIVGNKMFASYMKDATSLIKVFDLNGKFLSDLELPGVGSAGGVSGKKNSNEAFFSYTSFTSPNTIYKLNTETLKSEVFRQPEVDFDASKYETKQLWFTSKDGTKVPMFVTHKKGLTMDGSNPTLLYGYGGFDISITPSFSISRLPLLENGGVYAVANIRGGGEFGKDWHKAGTLGQKQNVFDDFQAAAEYLIAQKYTSSEKLAIQGGSNGGLLVGACITQRPDLYKVAFPAVGVLDMLRYHKFTIGWAWATDYGKSDDAEAFEYLRKYSPLHNVKEAAYPATMVTTADHDDRVVPAHSFKFISELQKQHTGTDPVLIRIETSAGHGAGKPTSKRIEEAADILSFMFYNMEEPVQFEVEG